MNNPAIDQVARPTTAGSEGVFRWKNFDVNMLPDGADSPLATEMVTFRDNLDRMMDLGKAGEFVAIKGDRILGYRKTRTGAFRLALSKVGQGPVLIKQVAETTPVRTIGGIAG